MSARNRRVLPTPPKPGTALACLVLVSACAFEQVADSLRALEHDAETLLAQEEALAAAQQALHLIQAKYSAGLATYLDVLNADAQLHQASIAEIQAIAVRYQDTVALIAALGGGWWNTEPGALGTSRAAHINQGIGG